MTFWPWPLAGVWGGWDAARLTKSKGLQSTIKGSPRLKTTLQVKGGVIRALGKNEKWSDNVMKKLSATGWCKVGEWMAIITQKMINLLQCIQYCIYEQKKNWNTDIPWWKALQPKQSLVKLNYIYYYTLFLSSLLKCGNVEHFLTSEIWELSKINRK